MRHRYVTAVLGAATLALGTIACNDFLSGPGVDRDPNNVLQLTEAGPLYLALQTSQAITFEGQLARLAAQYTQQIAGVARQFQGYDVYTVQPTDVDPYWQGIYVGGGLRDAREIQRLSLGVGDSTTAGISLVWEALIIGTAADFWGDIPYRQALVAGSKPTFDPQAQVYADIQAKLDTAIIYLSKTGTTNVGPRASELMYAGRSASGLRTVYTQVAHTLKARFYLHGAEGDATNYGRARTEALLGINSPANDFLFYHASDASSNNIHYQFYGTRGDVLPGAALVNLVKSRVTTGKDNNIERLAFYFTPACGSATTDVTKYFGYRPSAAEEPGGTGSPAGVCPSAGSFSDFNFIANNSDFRQPIITWAEKQLILAETNFRLSGQAAAQPFLNAVRTTQTYGTETFSAQPSIPATLQNIIEEKYYQLFLNPEVWNDYKRTCLPALAPAPNQVGGTTPGSQPIPGRIPYGLSEFSTNAANVPNASATGRNANDPQACPILNYTSSSPLGY